LETGKTGDLLMFMRMDSSQARVRFSLLFLILVMIPVLLVLGSASPAYAEPCHIKVEKKTLPTGADGTFYFTKGTSDFHIHTSGGYGSETLSAEEDHTYTITEQDPGANWNLQDIACSGTYASCTPDKANRRVTVTIDHAGHDVTVTFTNKQTGTTLSATKTAAGHWTRTYHWTIDKSVTPGIWNLFRGDSGASQYTVAVTKDSGTEEAFVDGQICVTNGGDVATEGLQITDKLYNGVPPPNSLVNSISVDVSAHPVLAAGETYCYNYRVDIPSDKIHAGGTYKDTASVTITNHSGSIGTPKGPSVSATTTLPSSIVKVNDLVHVTDTYGGPWTFSSSGSQTYARTFTCDGDQGEHANTATITETGQSDGASVTVSCHAPVVSKTAQTYLTRTYEWSIVKSVDPASWTLYTGESGTSTYTVSVTRTGYTDSDWRVEGTITVSNPSPIEATINSVSDVISGVGSATVNCVGVTFPYSLPAGGTLTCTYSASLPNADTRTNTATATLQNHSFDYEGSSTNAGTTDFTGTASVDFSGASVTEVNKEIHVNDSNNPSGSPWTFTDSGSQTYTRTFTCDGDDGTHDNTATITETGQSDDASVTVECSARVPTLEVSKTVSTSLTRTYEWTIVKSVDPASWTLYTGESGTSTYTVSVTRTGPTDSGWAVSGTITVYNNGLVSSTIDSVTDMISPDIGATVECSVEFPYELDVGDSFTCTYSASLPNADTRTNTVTVTVGTTEFSGTASVDFSGASVTEVNKSIHVTDTNGGSWLFGDTGSQTYTKTFTCDDDDGTHANTATITETGQSDDASVTVECSARTPTATLIVKKYVDNEHGGTLDASAFSVHVTANGVDVAGSPQPGSEAGTEYTLSPGTYLVSEATPLPSHYVLVGITGDCQPDGTVTLNDGDTKTCTITNADPTLIVIKHVIGGTSSASDFTITIRGVNPDPATFQGSESGIGVALGLGDYRVAETPIPGYTATYSPECSGTISIEEPTKTCTITNEYPAGQEETIKPPVGGEVYSINKLALLSPYLALLALLGAVGVAFAMRKRRDA
jgi:hypothetical protein